MMKALVTGAGGFFGSHLIQQLNQRSYNVEALDLNTPKKGATLHANWHLGDIRDTALCNDLVNVIQPDTIFHLAGGLNFSPLAEMYSTNVQGTLNLLEALRNPTPQTTMVYVSSGAIYGNVPLEQQPIHEDNLLNPITPNGASKLAADLLCYHYANTYGLRIIRVRPFNLFGPGQSDRFVCAAFAHQLAEIKFGLRAKVLNVGNLNSSRDFLDVRDAADGLIHLAEHGRQGEAYNLCSGQATVIHDVLNFLIALSELEVDVHVAPARLQQTDVPVQFGSYAKILQETGWKPEIPFERTLKAIWADWCDRVHMQAP